MATKRAFHDGSVYQRGDGYWVASLRLASGKRVTRYSKTRPEAEKTLQELRKQDVRGTLAAPSKVTLSEWFDQWMTTRDVRPSTVRIYKNTMTPAVTELAKVRLDKLTPLLLTTTFSKLAQNGMGARQLQLGHGYLRACLDQAVEMGLLSANPMLKVKKPRHQPQQRRYWSLEEASRFLVHCEAARSHWAPLYIVLATCGLRISEALGLQWSDVDVEARTVTLSRGLVWVGAEWSIGPLKTNAAYRVVTLPERAMAALQAVRPEDCTPETPVFRSIHGNPPRHDQLHKPLATLCKQAGVSRLNVHSLRHVSAALSYRATGDAFAVQRRHGHSSVATTMKIYAYLMHDDATTASALDNILSQKPEGDTSAQEESSAAE